MTVNVGDALRAAARWVGPEGQDVVNVFHFEVTGSGPASDSNTFNACDAAISAVFSGFDDHIELTMEPYDLKVDVVEWDGDKWAVTQNVGYGTWGSTITAVGASDWLPSGVAVLGLLRTALGKHTGRKFFGGLGEGQNDDGKPTAALKTAVLSGLTTLLTPTVIDATEYIVSSVLDTVTGTIRNVLDVEVGPEWAYQRRRRPGTGS